MSVKDARANDEIISLADSQMLRWIDELNGVTGADDRARRIKNEIRRIKFDPEYPDAKKRIRFLYDELDHVEFKPDYMSIVMDTAADYRRACKGFFVNGVKYVRLLGTPGGIKLSTIVFVSERLAPELRRRIDNGRDMSMKLVPAKYEAYRALTCSGSVPVSMPRGIAVVDEFEVTFNEPAIMLRDGENGGEPVMTYSSGEEIALNVCDGCGMMLPSLAERWSREVGLGYVMSGCNTRMSWEKGMLFTFDFLDFAENVAHSYIIKDVWGNDVDLREVEAVFPASMVKLWKGYKSCEEYINNSIANHYTFALTKVCPEVLDNERLANYQFLQPYHLDDSDLEELLAPTVQELRDILSDDPMKSVLFMKGTHMSEQNVMRQPDDCMKGVMIDRSLVNDPYVRRKIQQAVQGRINDAKIGRIKLHGNYSIASGDLYALCEHMFGMPVNGVLPAGELYSKYWADADVDTVVCFRAPMSCHNNIRTQRVSRNEDAAYWFRYMKTATVFNVHDSLCHALNGADFDGDLVFTTDNRVLVRNTLNLPVIMCEQGNAPKVVPDEDIIINSNINGFGDDIGKITNRITAMFDVQSQYDPGSEEYKVLDYRIQAGQLLQQAAIDRIKGIVSNPMPKEWYSRDAVYKMPEDTDEQRKRKDLYLRIVADRKPYFQRYIYNDIMRQYNTFIKNTRGNCISRFRVTPQELMQREVLTDNEAEFLKWYFIKMPLGIHDSITNRICRRIEDEFDGYMAKNPIEQPYDYSTLILGGKTVTHRIQTAIRREYDTYENWLSRASKYFKEDHNAQTMGSKNAALRITEQQILLKCPNIETACDVALELCVKHRKYIGFLWDVFGDVIIARMLDRNGGVITIPIRSDNGDITFCGDRFEAVDYVLGEIEYQPDFE